jgi:hypothetical protein
MLDLVGLEPEIEEKVEKLARATGRNDMDMLRELVEVGLKNYHGKSIKALLELAEWAEKNNIVGPKDLSTNHDKYAWDEE